MRFIPLSEAETPTQQQPQPEQLRFIPLSEVSSPRPAPSPARAISAEPDISTSISPEFGGAAQGPTPPPTLKYTDIVSRDDLFDVANRAMKAYGKPTFDPNKESREDFIERFYTQQRWATNNDISVVSLANALKNSRTETARDLAAGLRLFNEAEGSPKIGSAFIDYAASIGLSPSTYLGFGAGKVVSSATARAGVKTLASRVAAEQAAGKAALEAAKTPAGKAFARSNLAAIEPGRQAAKAAIERKATRAGVATSVVGEGAAAAATDIQLQRAEIEARKLVSDLGETVPEEIQLKEEEYKTDEEGNVLFDQKGNPIVDTDINWVRTGISTALASGISGAASAATTKTKIADRGTLIDQELKRRGINIPKSLDADQTVAEKEISKALNADFDATVSQLIKDRGKELLNEYDPATALTDAKVKDEFVKNSTRVALNVLKQNPQAFGYTGAPDQKISDVVYRIITSLDEVDDIGLERAVTQAGMSLEDFAKMNLTTASEAGRSLQRYSAAAKAAKKLREIDPGLDDRLKKLYAVNNDGVDSSSLAMSLLRRGDRETKALVVSGIDTTARNTIGNTFGLTLKAATDLIEGSVLSIGKAAVSIGSEKGAVQTLKEGMGDSLAKAVGTFNMIRKAGLAEDITENLLANNPMLLRRISSVTEDVETENISRLSRWANTLNSGMDGLFRRASFVSSVNSQLRDLGIDLYKDVLAKNKEVPADILKRAIDDSFKDTFSYSPKEFAKSFSSFEDAFERAGSAFVKTFEIPGLSLVVTFPRFVTNAIAFQYKYSPVGLVGSGQYLSAALKAQKAGNAEQAAMLAQTGFRKSIEATLGTAMLAAAYEYRLNNQDTNFNEIKTGSGTIDIKQVFPLPAYFGFADVLVKAKTGVGKVDTKGITESLIGFKAPAGTQNTILENILDFFGSEEKQKNAMTEFGKLTGDYTGRIAQPFVFKQLYDFLDLLRGDEAMKARDPNLIEAETTGQKMVDAAVQRVQAKLPVTKEQLPAAVPRFKDVVETSKEGEFTNRIVGFRAAPQRSDAEKEIVKYGSDIFKLYGPSSKDREFDRMFIERANLYTVQFVDEVIKRPDYVNETPTGKKKMIDRAISMGVSEARSQVVGEFTEKNPAKMSRIRYLGLSKDDKKIVNERYAKEHGGRSMEEDEAYNLLENYADFKMFKYANGGVIEQTNKLFGK